jgi:DNA-directed RNA polymerase specialized sigma24 family protein
MRPCAGVAQRDRDAFETLVERYQQRAYRLAWSILRDAGSARLSQEAFIRLRRRGSFHPAPFSTWFYRILVNLSWTRRRAAGGISASQSTEDGVSSPRGVATGWRRRGLAREQLMTQLWKAVENCRRQRRH